MSATPFHRGKVRDSYDIDDQHMLIVASDRISVFDVVLGQAIPGKGEVLTALTKFWLSGLFKDIPSHMVTGFTGALPDVPGLEGRSMVVRRADMLPIECIVRGYLYGSVTKEYEQHGTASGVVLPRGLVLASRLPEPIFTPSTKAPMGKHDENITLAQASELVDPFLLARVRDLCLEIYVEAAAYALERGIIIADTKFELGLVDGVLTLCDEVLTPDSSRFWEASLWIPGCEPISLDKQPVRDHLAAWRDDDGNKWNRKPPAPNLTDDVVLATELRYAEVERRLTAA